MDPDGTGSAENGSAFTGLVFDKNDLEVTSVDFVDNYTMTSNFISNDQSPGPTSDYLSYDLGAGTVQSGLDQNIGVNATILLGDGSTVSRTLSILQTQNGDTFINEWTSTSQLDGLNIQSITIDSVWQVSWGGATTTHSINGAGIVCFGRGTEIATPGGGKAVETLEVGDLVDTLDKGPQPVKRIYRHELKTDRKTAPIVFEPGAIGPGYPARRMTLSPQHRVLCRSKVASRMFGADEVLVAAKHLTGMRGIRQHAMAKQIEYFHIELAQHGIIFANGAAVESCLRGEATLRAYPRSINAVVEPETQTCRIVPDPKRQRKFVRRSRRNDILPFQVDHAADQMQNAVSH
jgi:hypothetical protein